MSEPVDFDDGREPSDEELAELMCGAGPRQPLPEEDLRAIHGAVERAWRERVRQDRPRRRLLRVGAALALAASVLLGIGLWRSRAAAPPLTVAFVTASIGTPSRESDDDGTRAPVRVGTTLRLGERLYTTQGDSRLALRLTSGVVLRLDAGSEVRLASSRGCELARGALYVDTDGAARGAGIEVRTPLAVARDVGTRFAVRLTGDGAEALHVHVRGGVVAVEREQRREITRAGEELTLHRDGSLERREAPVYGPAWDWVLQSGPRFEVEGHTLVEVLEWVGNETGWQVHFDDPSLATAAAAIRVGGSIGDLPADRAAFAVLAASGLVGELRDGTLLVHRSGSAPR